MFNLQGNGLEEHSLLNKDAMKKILLASRGRQSMTSYRCCIIAALLTVAVLWLTSNMRFRNADRGNPEHLKASTSSDKSRDVGRTAEPKVSVNVEADLVVLPQDLADAKGAYCLDGSPPSYYLRKASSKEHQNSWIILLMFGAWCTSDGECARRSGSSLGSSRKLKAKKLFGGFLSSDSTINPDFYDWNVAIVNYCDGGSFAGDREDPVIHKGKKIYYRGLRVLYAVIGHLLQSAGLQNAKRVILSGQSAGALAVFLHADRVSKMVPGDASFKAISDSGFFVAETDTSGKSRWVDGMKELYKIQQVEGALDEDCLLAKEKDRKWECFFAQYAYLHVTTPLFVVHSLYDSWTLSHVLGVRCRPPKCSEKDIGALGEHRRAFLQATDQINHNDKDGMFLVDCYNHMQTQSDSSWINFKVAGKKTREAFADWYYERTALAKTRLVDCDSSLTCNPSCRVK